MKNRIFYIFLLIGGYIVMPHINAQETISKEVRVVKPYEPRLSDAYKINLLPVMDDTLKITTETTYTVYPKDFQPVYEFKPLKPARMESEYISKLYHSYLKLGFGSTSTPYGELSITNLRSKTWSIGTWMRHISSYSNVKLKNGQKAYAGYGDTDFLLHGKKVFKKLILSAELGVNQDWMHYYGYNPELDTTLHRDDIRQDYLDIYGGLKMQSAYMDSNHLNYKFQANYHYFKDRFDNVQNEFYFDGRLNKIFFKNKMFGLDFGGLYLGSKMDSLPGPVTYINFKPWYSQITPLWRLDLALNVNLENESGKMIAHIYPNARFHFNVVPQYLTAFVGVKGEFESHTYRQMVAENPYQIPGLNVKGTDRKMNFFGGFNGSFSRKSAYHIRASYSLADQMYFFVNDTLSGLGNQFYFEYDDVQITRIFGEVSTQIGPSAWIFLKANYYHYGMSVQARAWNKPDFDATVVARYNFRKKLMFELEGYYVGKRYAKSYEFARPEIALDGFVDMNFKAEYQFTKLLSFYLTLNNILGKGYEIWNQYPVQRFAVFGGFTYTL